LDFQAMGFIDITGIDELRSLKEELKERNIVLAIMDIHLPVKEVMISSGFINEIEEGCLIDNRGMAIASLFKRIDHDYCKNVCPYELFYECVSVK
jgi:SulP family sulfate permease